MAHNIRAVRRGGRKYLPEEELLRLMAGADNQQGLNLHSTSGGPGDPPINFSNPGTPTYLGDQGLEGSVTGGPGVLEAMLEDMRRKAMANKVRAYGLSRNMTYGKLGRPGTGPRAF